LILQPNRLLVLISFAVLNSVGKGVVDEEYLKELIGDVVRASKVPKSGAMTSVSRSDVFHRIQEDETSFRHFDILSGLSVDELDTAITIPDAGDALFTDREVPERSVKNQHRQVIQKGTQELMFDRVRNWRPRGRIMDASCQDTPNLGSIKLDVILRETGLGGELSIMALCEMKKLPGNNVEAKEFAPDEMGQALEFGLKVMEKQPWRPHVYVGLSDTRRFKFFKISRRISGFFFEYSHMFMDVKGWEVLRLLVCQTAETLGYVQCSITGWEVGDILGIGGTAVVAKARHRETAMEVVAKLYTGDRAQMFRDQEALALSELQGIPNIPQLVNDAPVMTAERGRPVLLKYPLGFAVGDGVFPFISDFVPLVDALKAIHDKGWLHNDVAPANIFFSKLSDTEEPVVFLNDFGSATKDIIGNYPAIVKSRPLFYGTNSDNTGFAIGRSADLRALVLSIFVLTQPYSYDKARVISMGKLKAIAMLLQPWKNALVAAEAVDYEGVKVALNSTLA
jgi:hypothetical protein